MRLTEEQLTILELLADDRSPTEICGLLEKTADSLERDVRRLLTELKVASTGEAVDYAIREGLIGPFRSARKSSTD